MDTKLRTSRVPSNYVFQQILSPLALSLGQGLYDHFVILADAISTFAKTMGILPYDQTLAGRYIDYLYGFKDLPEDDPQSVVVQDIIMHIFDLYDGLSAINVAASQGGYITPIVQRVDTGVTRTAVTSFATGLAKDCIVSMLPAVSGLLVDLCGGDGNLLDTFNRMQVDPGVYLDVDINHNTTSSTFEANKRRYLLDNQHCDPDCIGAEHMDINDFLAKGIDADVYLSIHSLYYLTPESVSLIHDSHAFFSGVAHFSDTLFIEGDHEADDTGSVVKNDLLLTGHMGGYKIDNEPMMFSDDVGAVYPLRFLTNARMTLQYASIASKSLCMWSPSLLYRSGNIGFTPGIEFRLVAANFNSKNRRSKIYELDQIDYYYLCRMGFYISAKLDGLCGFLNCVGGMYYLSLRDGQQFLILQPNGKPVNLGVIDRTINVEVVINPATNLFQLWFVSYSPMKYPTDPAFKRKYWQDVFSSWFQTVELAKFRHSGLFFKQYLWVPRDSDKALTFDIMKNLHIGDYVIPVDGLTFHDPYGNFVGFWKPWHTADVTVYGPEPLYTLVGTSKYTVLDPECRFIVDGVYEVYVDDGQINIIQSRIEKQKTSDMYLDKQEQRLFACDFNSVQIGPVKVLLKFNSFADYVKHYGENYTDSLARLSPLFIEKESLILLYKQVVQHLVKNNKCFNGCYTVSQFVSSISATTTHPVQKLWSSFIAVGLMKGGGPFKPDFKCIDGVYKAVIEKPVVDVF